MNPIFLQELSQWPSNISITFNKPVIVSCETQNSSQALEILWRRPINHVLDFSWICNNSLNKNDVLRKFNVVPLKTTLLLINQQLVQFQRLKHLGQILLVNFPIRAISRMSSKNTRTNQHRNTCKILFINA